MARKTTAEIKKLLKETSKMKNADAAKHIGISIATLYKWKEKASTPTIAPIAVATIGSVKPVNKKLNSIVNSLKAVIAKLEKEMAK